ncbi:MAG: acetate/propionate family kinase [Polyangiaceae bacterium]
MQVLVLNSGSSSLKAQLVDTESGACKLQTHVDRIGEGAATHESAVADVLGALGDHTVDAVGHRIVHGGSDFSGAVQVTEAVEAAIERNAVLAPLHNPANLLALRAARAKLPGVPHVAVFDTAFHARMPRRSRTYAIDSATAERHGIYRYGFHGTSHGYVAHLAAKHLGVPLRELRILTLHLGNGASACAVEYGHSTDTSMGMTPLEGLVMGTRSGDVDPGALLALLRAGLDAGALDELLNRKSGLLGLSGVSKDLRDLEQRAAEGHDGSRLAIGVFAHRVRRYIGALAASMGGMDALVLTGGIGESGVAMRQRMLQRLEFLGLRLDDDKNSQAKVSQESPVFEIGADNSRVRVLVVKTNEELSIARQTAEVLARNVEPSAAGPIPIAISARHVHLDDATFQALFGPGTAPTVHREISQPGQFACNEKLTLVGPRGRIEGVRVLGPLRSKNQVEVSRTDEFKLGVDAPIRDSGKVDGSAPITLEGPAGTVHLSEGLICAKRHIHMTPKDAQAYGVADGEEVEVAIGGGPRDLVFGDVLVRVSPKYKLEMHIDTDEANAAELSAGAAGALVYEDVPSARATLRSKRVLGTE